MKSMIFAALFFVSLPAFAQSPCACEFVGPMPAAQGNAPDFDAVVARIQAMSPRSAAKIIAAMPYELGARVVGALEPGKAAKLLQAMPPNQAAQILQSFIKPPPETLLPAVIALPVVAAPESAEPEKEETENENP